MAGILPTEASTGGVDIARLIPQSDSSVGLPKDVVGLSLESTIASAKKQEDLTLDSKEESAGCFSQCISAVGCMILTILTLGLWNLFCRSKSIDKKTELLEIEVVDQENPEQPVTDPVTITSEQPSGSSANAPQPSAAIPVIAGTATTRPGTPIPSTPTPIPTHRTTAHPRPPHPLAVCSESARQGKTAAPADVPSSPAVNSLYDSSPASTERLQAALRQEVSSGTEGSASSLYDSSPASTQRLQDALQQEVSSGAPVSVQPELSQSQRPNESTTSIAVPAAPSTPTQLQPSAGQRLGNPVTPLRHALGVQSLATTMYGKSPRAALATIFQRRLLNQPTQGANPLAAVRSLEPQEHPELQVIDSSFVTPDRPIRSIQSQTRDDEISRVAHTNMPGYATPSRRHTRPSPAITGDRMSDTIRALSLEKTPSKKNRTWVEDDNASSTILVDITTPTKNRTQPSHLTLALPLDGLQTLSQQALDLPDSSWGNFVSLNAALTVVVGEGEAIGEADELTTAEAFSTPLRSSSAHPAVIEVVEEPELTDGQATTDIPVVATTGTSNDHSSKGSISGEDASGAHPLIDDDEDSGYTAVASKDPLLKVAPNQLWRLRYRTYAGEMQQERFDWEKALQHTKLNAASGSKITSAGPMKMAATLGAANPAVSGLFRQQAVSRPHQPAAPVRRPVAPISRTNSMPAWVQTVTSVARTLRQGGPLAHLTQYWPYQDS